MSPMRSKAGIHFFENWVKLLQCKGLKDTHCRPSQDLYELALTTRRKLPHLKCHRLLRARNGGTASCHQEGRFIGLYQVVP